MTPNILHFSRRRIKAAAEPRIPLLIKNTQTVDGFAHQVETVAKYVKKGAIDNKETRALAGSANQSLA